MSSLLLLLLLSLFMHECEARRLSVINDELSRQVSLSGKNMENPSLLLEEIQRKLQGVAAGESLINESQAGANAQKPKNYEDFMKEVEESKGPISGSESLMSSSNVGLQQATKTKGSERRERSVLGSASHVSEETIVSKENDFNADVVGMDYEQPHRTPPIHNASP